ncbi:MAG TPA: hypothetical protein VHQ45_10730 [Gemmatimonadaceae bacterium]|nr:hypothetical protein [Gemmatimonadaceae bacterium]
MQRSPLLLAVPLAVLATLAACSDSPAPTSPPPLDTSTSTCQSVVVQQSLVRLYPDAGTRTAAFAIFGRAQDLAQRGQQALARAQYYALVDDVTGRYQRDELSEARSLPATQSAVTELVGVLIVCAGDDVPPGLSVAIAAAARESGDSRICVGVPGQSLECLLPNHRLDLVLEPGFLARPALVIIESAPFPFEPIEDEFGTQWSRTWEVRIEPTEAQANFPGTDDESAPSALVAVCVVDRVLGDVDTHHPDRPTLRVAQSPAAAPDEAVLLPPETVLAGVDINTRLDCAAPPGASLSLSLPFGRSWLGRAAWGALRSTGAAISGVLRPTIAYAFDGGIGGKTKVVQSFYAAVRVDTLVFRSGTRVSPGDVVGTLTLRVGEAKPVTLSVGTGDFVPPDGICTFTSSNPAVATIAIGTSGNAASIRGFSPGTAVMRATCASGAARQLDVTVVP